MNASVILCTRDRPRSLAITLAALEQIEWLPQTELVIVDNGDTALEVPALAVPVPVRCVREPKPGLAGARNAGIAAAAGQILVFLDDDVTPDRAWLVEHVAAHDGVAAVQGKVELGFEAVAPRWLGTLHRQLLAETQLGDAEITGLTAPLIGANMSIARRAFEAIGPFDPRLGAGRAGCFEETAWSRKLLAAGNTQRYVPGCKVTHRIGSDRLTAAAFRRQAFALGVSRWIAGDEPVGLGHKLRRARETPLRELELHAAIELGTLWARANGIRRLSRRYGDDVR